MPLCEWHRATQLLCLLSYMTQCHSYVTVGNVSVAQTSDSRPAEQPPKYPWLIDKKVEFPTSVLVGGMSALSFVVKEGKKKRELMTNTEKMAGIKGGCHKINST